MSPHDKVVILALGLLSMLTLGVYFAPPAHAWLAFPLVAIAIMIAQRLWLTREDRATIFGERTSLLAALSAFTVVIGFVLPHPLEWWRTGALPRTTVPNWFTLWLAAPFAVAGVISYWLNSVLLIVILLFGLAALSIEAWITVAFSRSSTRVLEFFMLPIHQLAAVAVVTVLFVVLRSGYLHLVRKGS